jgi:hypothetical protein
VVQQQLHVCVEAILRSDVYGEVAVLVVLHAHCRGVARVVLVQELYWLIPPITHEGVGE